MLKLVFNKSMHTPDNEQSINKQWPHYCHSQIGYHCCNSQSSYHYCQSQYHRLISHTTKSVTDLEVAL